MKTPDVFGRIHPVSVGPACGVRDAVPLLPLTDLRDGQTGLVRHFMNGPPARWLDPLICSGFYYKPLTGCPVAGTLNIMKWTSFPPRRGLKQNVHVDRAKIAAGIRLVLEGLGEDPDREGLRDTPARVARFYAAFCRPPWTHTVPELLGTQFTVTYDHAVQVRRIPFVSLCEHHLLPFRGWVDVAYVPEGGRVVGLSKLARVVDAVAGRLQLQERLTEQIAEALSRTLEPRGVRVVVAAEHLCMTIRGVRKSGSYTVTEAVRGCYGKHQATSALFDDAFMHPEGQGPKML